MCGICGIYGLEDKELVKKMCQTLVHRGPDDQGIYTDSNISLGHRRLSIIDLKTGHQPIHNEDETVWVILNGEIYNFRELREDLEDKHDFYTDSDTEVLVHLYEEYGERLVEKLNGMFAFAIWDSVKRKLLLARDHIGKKPLYYHWDGEKLIFASEIKAVLEAGIKKEIDLDALYSYLAYQYTIGEKTLFKGVRKLLGGHFLVIGNKELKIEKYWEIKENVIHNSEANLIKRLRLLLEKSATYRMIADVPIGAFLSGGLDSSAVVALTRPLADYEFHTFSVGFETFSELKYAKKVSEYLDTVHHEIVITPDMVAKNIEKIAWHYDEPLGDAAIINNYFLSKEARKHVKVVIAGEAGDELFAGYPNYKMNLRCCNLFKIPFFSNVIGRIVGVSPKKGDVYRNRIERFLTGFAQVNFENYHLYTTRSMSDDEIKWLTHLNHGNIEQFAIYPRDIKHPLNRMLALDCKNLLPEKFLMKADKATMANSVEERLPLMDKNIVEFAFSIPPNLKLRNGQEKYILKMAVKDLLPIEIIKRKKQGFGTPVDNWMSKGELKDMVIQKLSDNELIKRYSKEDKIDKMIQNLNRGNTRGAGTVWTIFALGLWYDTYFKGDIEVKA
jgi:asparagine synthase (glutamine-hydrolysing)